VNVRTRTVRRTEWTGGEIEIVSIEAAGTDDADALPSTLHLHDVPGIWDATYGSNAGKVCGTCWKANRPVALDALLAARWARERREDVR